MKIYKLIKETKAEIKEEIRELRNEVRREIDSLKERNNKLEIENSEIKNKLVALERKIKKYNLVIYGLEDREKQTLENVIKLFQEKLNVKCRKEEIRDVYKIGKEENKPRPIIVEFVTNYLKIEILKNTKKLKGSGIFICQDYTSEDYQKIKYLNGHLKAARQKNYDAKIRNYTLIVNGEKYSYDDLKAKETGKQESQEVNIRPLSSSEPSTPSRNLENTHFFDKSPLSEKTEAVVGTAYNILTTVTQETKPETETGNRKLESTPANKETGTKPKILNRERPTRQNSKSRQT